MITAVRVAWFSPLPPVRSGIATYSAELLPRLGSEFEVDGYVDRTNGVAAAQMAQRPRASSVRGELLEPGATAPRVFAAHDFVWKHQRAPYDLVVYQLGNAPCHDYMWGYLVRYPGLVVLHDGRLHHARARRLLNQKRFDDYRREFWYDHPKATADFVEYAVEGLGGPIYYFWPMLRVVMQTARGVAVHNARVAAELREQYADVPVDIVRMGVASLDVAQGRPVDAGHTDARTRVRHHHGLPNDAIVFGVFGKVTAEKRVTAILRALGAIATEGANVFLLLVGDTAEYPTLDQEIQRAGVAERVRITGYVDDEAVGAYLAAADACLCLRWPTAQETSASWLRCLAAARATVVSDLSHLVDVPTMDPLGGGFPGPRPTPIAIRVDLLEEDDSLRTSMRLLATDARLRSELARAGHAYWMREHTLELMALDYWRLMKIVAVRPAPVVADLPAHFTHGHAELARRVAREFGVKVDI